MKTILMTSAAMLLTVGVAMAQTTAAGTGGTTGSATSGANAGMAGGTTGMTSNQTATGSMSTANGGTATSRVTGRGPSPGGMSMAQIQHKLATEGYVHIKDLRHNARYEMVNAHRYGSYQKSLKIDPTTGAVVDQAKLSDSQVRNMLKAHHYTDIDSVTHHGNMIMATAKKGGQKSKLTINAQTGKIQSS